MSTGHERTVEAKLPFLRRHLHVGPLPAELP